MGMDEMRKKGGREGKEGKKVTSAAQPKGYAAEVEILAYGSSQSQFQLWPSLS